MESIDKLREAIEKGKRKAFGSTAGYYRAVDDAVNAIEQEIADNYMKLPLDADGVPIHVGDELEYVLTQNGRYKTQAINEYGVIVESNGKRQIGAALVRHVKPRTIEDVLYDFGRDERWNDEGESVDIEREIIAKYAAEIRKIMGVDA